jgi:hypothetical protein
MNYRPLIVVGKWIAGSAAYVAASVVVSRFFVSGMQAWALDHGTSRGFAMELLFWGRPVLVTCLICGSLYASAFAKPASFGGRGRVSKHLAATYSLNLVACILLARSQFLPLPDFRSDLLLQSYLFLLITLPWVCFALAFLAWIRLAFGNVPIAAVGSAETES